MKFIKPELISLKNHPELDEKWVQDRIADDPSILGLGSDLILKDKERIQPQAGRLDILLQDADTSRRYEVEIQLGKTDESHIIRTIEYWDIERKRYPQYDHCAVIVAEDITSRFLNIISLFNGSIPLIAIQMSALKIEDGVALTFTRVLDELSYGLDEDDEEKEVTDRTYWEEKSSKEILHIIDELLNLIHGFAPSFELKYNKFYIGLVKTGSPNNFVVFKAKKSYLRLEIRLDESDDIQKKLESAGLDIMDYDKRWGRYRIRITKEDVRDKKSAIVEILQAAYKCSVGE